MPPQLESASDRSLTVVWQAVTFCGINSPQILESVSYSLEIAEGVEWKDGMLSRYINDVTALDYKEVCNVKSGTIFVIEHLKPATWYHVRLAVHYLGFRVASESMSMHTVKAAPSPPGEPRISILPVKNSFDTVSDEPKRLDVIVTWTPSQANGQPVQRYQVHVKRFDHEGAVLYDDPPMLRKRSLPDIKNSDKAIGGLIKQDRKANQWIQSKGKSLVQIQHSIVARENSPSRSRSRSPSLSPTPGQTLSSTKNKGSQSHIAWKIVYDNLSRSVRLGSPYSYDGTWWIRIRARNTLGWSDFSPIVVLSRASHPTLFALPTNRATITVYPTTSDDREKTEDLPTLSRASYSIEEESELDEPAKDALRLHHSASIQNLRGSATFTSAADRNRISASKGPEVDSPTNPKRTTVGRPSSRSPNLLHGGLEGVSNKGSSLPSIRL